jgi:type II secretory pathway component PulF
LLIVLAALLIFVSAAYTNSVNTALGNSPGNFSAVIIMVMGGVVILVSAAMYQKKNKASI